MSDQAMDELEARVFAASPSQPLPPLQAPGVENRLDAASQMMRGPVPTPGAQLLSADELPRARTFARVLAQLIQNTQIPIALIAEQTGFQTLTHFSVIFKAKIGRSPSGYRAVGARG